MKKTLASIVDELITTNIKIFYLVDKVQKNRHTRADAKKLQDLNQFRSELINALNYEFKQRKIIRV